jgi:hypothetical protein
MSRKRIGDILLERNAITPAQLEAGLAAQKRTRQRLGVTLVQQGLISEVQLAQALGASLNLGTVDLAQAQADWSAVHMLRARFCEAHELFPFAIDKQGPVKRLLVALSDPLNQPAIEEIEFTTGLKVLPYVSTHSQVRAAILRYYHKHSQADAEARAKTVVTAVPRQVQAPVEEEEAPMVVGEEIISMQNVLPSKKKEGVAKDLDFLFGGTEDSENDDLERKFWALLRAMQKKGLLSREEFLSELEKSEP